MIKITGKWLVLLAACLAVSGCKSSKAPTQAKYDLGHIMQMYHKCTYTNRQPPTKVKDLEEFAVLDALMESYKKLEAGQFVVVWNTPISKDPARDAKLVLAFERDALTKGGFVQMVDPPTMEEMTAEELRAALKENPAWKPEFADKPAVEPVVKKPDAAGSKTPKNPAKVADGDKKPIGPAAGRDLHFLFQAYKEGALRRQQPPRDPFELELAGGSNIPEIRNAYEGVRSGTYLVVWGIDLDKVTDKKNAVLAYEKDVPVKGGWVVTAAGEVKKMTAKEFQDSPKLPNEKP